jgi:uncharacterized protein (TIGR04255 family)
MTTLNSLKPYSENHSVKEAVISIFLESPLTNVNEFVEWSNSFSDFHQLSTVNIEIKPNAVAEVKPTAENQRGFRFNQINDKGQVSRVMMGRNDPFAFIVSFHSLLYVRWEQFLSEFKENLALFLNFYPDFKVIAFSLLVIDEFKWESNQKLDLKDIFISNPYIPETFFKNGTQSSIVFESEYNGIKFAQNLAVIAPEQAIGSLIISHNVAKTFTSVEQLKTFLEKPSFNIELESAHQVNKDMLKSILNKEMCELIKLGK